MSWTGVRHSAKQFSTDTDDDLARVWQVENGVGETAWIEVSVSGQARMTLLGPGYRSATHEALKSKGGAILDRMRAKREFHRKVGKPLNPKGF